MTEDRIDIYNQDLSFLRTENRGEFMFKSRDAYLRGEQPNELVEAVIIQYVRTDGAIPLQLRREEKTENPGLITFTVTGHHQTQDSEHRVAGAGWRQAARRETLEEIGLKSRFPTDHIIKVGSNTYTLFELLADELERSERESIALGRRVAVHPHYKSHRRLHESVRGGPASINRDWYLTVASAVFTGELKHHPHEVKEIVWFKNYDELYERVFNEPERFADDVPTLLREHGPDLIPALHQAHLKNPGKVRLLNGELTRLIKNLTQREASPSPRQLAPYGPPV